MKHKQIRSWLQHFPRWKLLQTKRVFPVSVIFMFLICYYTLPKVLVADCCQIYTRFLIWRSSVILMDGCMFSQVPLEVVTYEKLVTKSRPPYL